MQDCQEFSKHKNNKDMILQLFVLEDKNQFLPKDHPVIFDLYSPDNQLFQRKVKTSSVNGFYDFRTATDADSPTGNWLAKVKVGGANFSIEVACTINCGSANSNLIAA